MCLGDPWPCQYFRLTAPSDGRLTVELRYRPEERRPPGRFGLQGVDISVGDASGFEVWANFGGARRDQGKPRCESGCDLSDYALVQHLKGWSPELQTTLDR